MSQGKGQIVVFGYIICNKKGLSKEENQRYQKIYCGLCNALKKQYGQMERLSLSFDMTFLALFLTALYEPEENEREFRCSVHPVQKKILTENKYVDYAAAMTVALSYYKALDDWEDEQKRSSYRYANLLKNSYCKVEGQYPRQCRALKESIDALGKIEKSPDSVPDEAINCSGRMLKELFVYEEDFWSNCLRSFGYELGRFIYLMDAVMDYKKDIKNNSYNPLLKMNKKPEEMEPILTLAIGNATEQFEKLPIIQDANLIRNILYGGVWQQYYAKMSGKEKAHD